MKAPDKIYVHELSAEELTENFPYHVCYVRKDALMEWVKEHKRMIETHGDERNAYLRGENSVLIALIAQLNSM